MSKTFLNLKTDQHYTAAQLQAMSTNTVQELLEMIEYCKLTKRSDTEHMLTISLATQYAQHLATVFYALMEEANAPNYLALIMAQDCKPRVEVLIQKEDALSPTAMNAKLIKENKELREEIEILKNKMCCGAF